MSKTISIRALSPFVLYTALICSSSIHAEEGGSGHYMPGSMSSSIDGVPATETFITRINYLTYSGSFDKNVVVPIAGLAATEVDVESQALGLTVLWRPPVEFAEGWSYAMSTTIPYVTIDVTASISEKNNSIGVKKTSSDSGIGDIILMPLMLNYTISPELNTNFRISAYAPTGDYQVGRLANTGKNFWSFEPTASLIYLSPKTGRELSTFGGITFNQTNNATDYQSGNQAHIESTFIQHVSMFGGMAGFGATAFWYQQISGDSGSGAKYGDFKARSIGGGPTLFYSAKKGNTNIIAELKWLHEFDTNRRAEGDTIFFKILAKF
jgi:hypothetical protein